MRVRLLAACLAGMLFFCAQPITAATWYVAPSTGNDANNGTTAGTAWQSMQNSIDRAAVQDGDIIVLTENFTGRFSVTKELWFSGASITVDSLSPEGRGIEILADNVRFANMTFFAAMPTAGIMIYAADPGDSILDDVRFNFCNFYSLSEAFPFPPPNSRGHALLEIHNPRGLVLQNNYFYVSGYNSGGPGAATPDNAVRILGGSGTSEEPNLLANNNIQPFGSTNPPFYAGTGISIRPGEGASAGFGANGFRLHLNYAAFGIGTAYEIRDTNPAAGAGISNIDIEQNSAYFNINGFVIHGLADDPGEGISNVLLHGNVGSYNTMENLHSLLIKQDGVGTSNIDFATVRMRHSSFFDAASNVNSYAAKNEIAGTEFDARYCYWGKGGPVVEGTGSSDNRISAGILTSPHLQGPSIGNLDWAAINDPGGTATLSLGPFTIHIDLEDGVTGEIAGARFYYDGTTDVHDGGTAGIVNSKSYPFVSQIETDLADGEFIAMIVYQYGQFIVEPDDIPEDQIALYTYHASLGTWFPAVVGNTRGSARWEGESAVPSFAAVTAADIGRYGVDTTLNRTWAIVDHFTEFVAGESNNGQGTVSSVGDWMLH